MRQIDGTTECRVHKALETSAAPVAVRSPRLLVLGIGNALLSDDGAGLHLLARLMQCAPALPAEVRYVDGGTVGLALTPYLEDCDACLVLDAMRLGAAPGTVHVYAGAGMDEAIARPCGTPHEVSLGDLFTALRLQGRVPERRALIGIEPGSIGWGTDPTPAVAASLAAAADTANQLLRDWAGAWCTGRDALMEVLP